MIDVDVDVSAFVSAIAALSKSYTGAVVNSVAVAVKTATDVAKRTTTFKSRTGATRASIEGVDFAGFGHVKAGGASVFLEEGTAPHEIRPRNGSHLRFVVQGALIFATKVNHPGTKPTFFMSKARDIGEQTLIHELETRMTLAQDAFRG